MGAKPETVSGLSGLGDIMLTCYGALSRNRAVGMRLGQGEALDDILASSSQVGTIRRTECILKCTCVPAVPGKPW